jgi:probable biosynthetic protein (TIGR04098 family)
MRCGATGVHLGLPTTGDAALRKFRFEPDPYREFNGAGLFYFVEFQALASRAFARWFPGAIGPNSVRRRDVFFSGNIRPGEALTVELAAFDRAIPSALCRIRRSDGKSIGSVFMRW